MLVSRPDGSLTVVAGASRSGKTVWTVRQLTRVPRALVWDAVGEWGDRYGFRRVDTLAELRAHCFTGRLERLAYFRAGGMGPREFDGFCRLAWIWIRAARGALVVEELAAVTSPGKAPAAWGDIVRAGLRYGPDIYALTQRPSESDKTVMGNATVLHCHAMARAGDRRYMAAELDIDPGVLAALRPLEWIERDRRDGELRRGALKFAQNRRPVTERKASGTAKGRTRVPQGTAAV